MITVNTNFTNSEIQQFNFYVWLLFNSKICIHFYYVFGKLEIFVVHSLIHCWVYHFHLELGTQYMPIVSS